MYHILFALLATFLPACEFEDSANCYWDAQGQGVNFIDIDGKVYYEVR